MFSCITIKNDKSRLPVLYANFFSEEIIRTFTAKQLSLIV